MPTIGGGDDFVWIGGPDEGIWLLVVLGDEAIEDGEETLDGVERARFDDICRGAKARGEPDVLKS